VPAIRPGCVLKLVNSALFIAVLFRREMGRAEQSRCCARQDRCALALRAFTPGSSVKIDPQPGGDSLLHLRRVGYGESSANRRH